jgi:hypothetical protein
MNTSLLRALPLLLSCAPLSAFAQNAPSGTSLQTVAERSKFQRTGRYDEVIRLCPQYQRTWPDAVRCTQFGTSPEGRPMFAMVVSRSGALTPEQARARKLPVMLVQAGIHAGEIDGKDAGFLTLRELLRNEVAPGSLKSFVLVFVPVFNVDGHERFGPWNRPNQRGPEQMGWRTTAQNFNLNRDYTKADAPEMRAMLKLLGAWDPILYVDLHVTDGAKFVHDVSNTLEPIYAGDPALHPAGRSLLAELNARMTAGGSLPLDFYPDFVSYNDPASGFAAGASTPRFSTGYWPLHNRFGLLVETHSWKDYPTRVEIMHRTLIGLSEMMATHGARWRTLGQESDVRAKQLAGHEVPIEYQAGSRTRMIDFRGYAYTREKSPISGGLVTRYDETRPQIWRVPLRDSVAPKTVVKAPVAGYVVPAAHAAWVGEKLTLHGIRFERIPVAVADAAVETFRADSVRLSSAPFESHTTAFISGQWKPDHRAIPAGSLFVPIAQPNARLIITLLEPRSQDSFAAWGFFNSAFEQKEYMESYVAEEVATEMMKDPVIAAEFRKRLEDTAFANSESARLDFFYRRHSSYDERLNLYPVYRTSRMP